MRLTVSGLNASHYSFAHLWGRYINGFRPWKHCIGCLVSNVAEGISPQMQDGSIKLENRLFYLCGVGKKLSENRHPEFARKFTNVHLAVRPRNGSVAAIGSVYGVTFIIEDAQAIPIEPLQASDHPQLSKDHYRCKNFQFGYQMFELKQWAESREP